MVCKTIYEKLPEDRVRANKFLLLSANNTFNEAIGILHTLLCSTKKEELIIKPLLQEIIARESSITISIDQERVDEFVSKIFEEYPFPRYCDYKFLLKNDSRPVDDIMADIRKLKRKTAIADLNDIKKEFLKKCFHKIRHQLVAHKNRYLSDPSGARNLYLKKIISIN